VPMKRLPTCRKCGADNWYFYPNGKRQCRTCASARRKERLVPGSQRAVQLKRNYGITLEEYGNMLRAQGGRCAICRSRKAGGKGRWMFVDHNHKTGKVRKLLCLRCNAMLGSADDSPERLEKAAAYLRDHQ